MSVCAAIFVSHWKEWTKLNFLYYFSLRSAIVLSCQISIIQNQILSFFLLITASSQDKKTSLVMNLKPFLQTKYTFVTIHLHIYICYNILETTPQDFLETTNWPNIGKPHYVADIEDIILGPHCYHVLLSQLFHSSDAT